MFELGRDEVQLSRDAWRIHSSELVRYATLLVGPSDATDVVSVAFSRGMDQLAHVENVRNYLLRAVTTTAFDQRRSARRRQVRDLQAVLPATTPGPDSDPDVRRAVAALSIQQRAVVYFTYWQDLTSEQTAEVLGIAPATVRRHLSRAHLRKALT